MPKKEMLRSVASTAFITLILILVFFRFAAVSGVSGGAVDFHADVTSGDAPLTVQFIDDTSISRSSWNWDFGDGTRDHAKDPVHTYDTPGTYSVSLNVISSGSQAGSEIKTNYIVVFAPVPVTVTPEPASVSIIPGVIDSPIPPAGTAVPTAEATPEPTSNATGAGGGFLGPEDTVQLVLAGGIAVVITAIVLYVFNNLSKSNGAPANKAVEKPAVKYEPGPEPRSNPKPGAAARPAKEKAPRFSKKSEDLSQDYIYGLVTGNAGNEDRSRARK